MKDVRLFVLLTVAIVGSLTGCQGSNHSGQLINPCKDSTYLALLHKPSPLNQAEADLFLRLSESCEKYQEWNDGPSPMVYVIFGALAIVTAYTVIAILVYLQGVGGH